MSNLYSEEFKNWWKEAKINLVLLDEFKPFIYKVYQELQVEIEKLQDELHDAEESMSELEDEKNEYISRCNIISDYVAAIQDTLKGQE